MRRRCIAWCVGMSMLFGGLSIRLYGLCTGTELAQAAQDQRVYTIRAGSARGTIYDCRGRPLTNGRWRNGTVVTATPAAVTAVQSVLGDDAAAVLAQLKTGKPVQVADLSLKDVSGAVTFQLPVRYTDGGIAAHVIGYTDGNGSGVCGIEQAYDALLNTYSGSVTVRYRADAWGRTLTGEPLETDDSIDRCAGGVVLTLDRDIQQMAEEIAEASLPVGAIVIMDVKNGKIRAMVSAPSFDPNHVEDALTQENAPLLNRALCSYNVGSVFKLVSACCAAEQGDTDLTIRCTGTIPYANRLFRCINGNAHGTVNLSRGIAISCNCYFIQLMDQIGIQPVYEMAQKMGFGQNIWLTSNMVSGGTLPALADLSASAAQANFSFGQGDLLATPLQVASMIQAIANNGQKITPSLVECTVNAEGVRNAEQEASPERVMSARTAELVRGYMIDAVRSGTATRAEPESGGAGAKTATAETGWYQNGKAVIQAWCAGFYPSEEPEYVITVFAENGRSGSAMCAPVFKQLADGLAALQSAE